MAMFRINVKKRARILTKPEFRRVLKVCAITREAIRNQLIMCLSHACGLRVTELALITIRDVMFASGRLRDELSMRPLITKNNVARTLPMTNELLVHHLELYLSYRIKNDIGMLPVTTEEFRGLSPDLPLLFSNRGGGFALARKKRVLETGEQEEYQACDALEQTFRHLYKISGMKGASSHSGRRTFASRLVEGGVPIEDVSHLLGHASIDFTYPYLETKPENIRAAFQLALPEE